jgi:hypothetical protein
MPLFSRIGPLTKKHLKKDILVTKIHRVEGGGIRQRVV